MSVSEDELAPFVLHNVEWLDRGEATGHGAYGVLSEVTVNGIPCVAKKLHTILVDLEVPSEQRKAIQKKFRQECILLSKLRHPNIVHFIGVSYGKHPGELTLIMERVQTDLSKLIGSVPAIPLPVKLSLLCDVSYGLLYLHSRVPPILHRDLTPRNVLVTKDMRAKLADPGGSKQLVNLHAAASLAPGATNYMPPEALICGERHEKLDVFSFGSLTLFTVNQREPNITNCISHDRDSCDTVEIARRQKDIDAVGKDHCLCQLIIDCLQDGPEKRPSTLDINNTLLELCLSQPQSTDDLSRLWGSSSEHKSNDEAELQRLSAESEKLKEAKERLITKVQDLVFQVEHYKRDAEASRRDAEDSREQAEEMRAEMRQLTWKERELTQECAKYRIEVDIYKTQAERERRKVQGYMMDLEAVRSSTLEPEKRHKKKKGKTISGYRDAFELKCADLERVVDMLQQENLKLFRENEELRRHQSPAMCQMNYGSCSPVPASETQQRSRALPELPLPDSGDSKVGLPAEWPRQVTGNGVGFGKETEFYHPYQNLASSSVPRQKP